MNVFKSAIITIFILATSLQACAQVNTVIGANGGWVQRSLLGSDANSLKVKSGFNAGAVFVPNQYPSVLNPLYIIRLNQEHTPLDGVNNSALFS